MPDPASTELENAVREALVEGWGITARLERLPGENVNFHVFADDGTEYVAKLAGDQQPAEFVELEHAALVHACQARLQLELPLIRENKFGNTETFISISEHPPKRLRLMEFVFGSLWPDYDISAVLRKDLGRKLAAFDRAMHDFDHPMAHRSHRWDLSRVDQHRDRIALVKDPDRRALLAWAFDQWTKIASPVLVRLSRQFIHGDANPENILVRDERVVGLVDFGDCCWNPPVCELAICLAYQMMGEDDPWAAVEPVISGFEEVLPLAPDERRILPALVCGRLANTLTVAADRRRHDPGHPNWFVSEAGAWSLLAWFRADPERSL